MATPRHDLKQSAPAAVRQAIRDGRFTGTTAGLAPGVLQVNLAIMPERYGLDFMRYCQRNPKPCPLAGVSETGDPALPTLGRDIDLRHDLPAYNIYRHGRLAGSATDIADLWQDDFVAFAIGCSFTFERALVAAGVPVRHVAQGTTVPMYRSAIQTVPAGPFGGPMVVSMRPIPAGQVALAREISGRYPVAHGAPVHAGDPAEIGIADIAAPDWGDPSPLRAGEVPVFWACGVTPQVALEQARLPLCITHKPGHMLVTDVADDAEVPVLTLA